MLSTSAECWLPADTLHAVAQKGKFTIFGSQSMSFGFVALPSYPYVFEPHENTSPAFVSTSV